MAKIAHLLLWALGLALLAFTGFRTLDFLSMTLSADQQFIKYLALAAFDGGVLLWFMFAKHEAKGWQRAISYIMIFVCLTGVCLCTWADTFLVSSHNGLVRLPPGLAETALYGVLTIILLNVVLVVVTHLVSPEALRQWRIESAHDKIEDQTLRMIDQGSTIIAPDISRQLAQQWQAQTYQNLNLQIPDELPQIEPPKKKQPIIQQVTGDVIERIRKSKND